MRRHLGAFAVLGALFAAAAALIVIELVRGAPTYGAVEQEDPCTAVEQFPGEGLDATLQRIVLSGLNGAACELGATRAELVLSFAPAVAPKPIEWDNETIERSVRSGLLNAIEDAEERGSIGDFTAAILREIVERAPLDWLIRGGQELADLFG
jgi:hypothetical protein